MDRKRLPRSGPMLTEHLPKLVMLLRYLRPEHVAGRYEGVRRLDSVSKSAAVLRYARRVHHALRLSRHAFSSCGFTNLEGRRLLFRTRPLCGTEFALGCYGKVKT